MAYKITISPRAQKEIEEAIDYYALHSLQAPGNFVNALKNGYETLSRHPYFRVSYKKIRCFKLEKFPYSLYYVILKQQNVIRVLSCFHNRRDPDKRP